MITAIWDFLFTRKKWTTIQKDHLYQGGKNIGWAILLQDQFGNIKKKTIKY